MPCRPLFSDEECTGLYDELSKKPPDKPIKLANLLNLIARFGGYLNKKQDLRPGPTALWIGLQKLRDFIQAKRIYDFIQAGKAYG